MEAETMETNATGNGSSDASDAGAEARRRLEEAESQARSFIRDYPLGSLVAAVVAGYVIARLLPRF